MQILAARPAERCPLQTQFPKLCLFWTLSGELVGGSRARARGNGCHSMGSEWHMPTGLGSLRIPLRSYQSYSAGLPGRGSTSR